MFYTLWKREEQEQKRDRERGRDIYDILKAHNRLLFTNMDIGDIHLICWIAIFTRFERMLKSQHDPFMRIKNMWLV